MRSTIVFLSSVALALCAAIPESTVQRDFPCIDQNDANQVANNFKQLISNYSTTTANDVLTTDFHDYSDSVNELVNNGCPTGPATLGTPTFTSRDAFETGQGGQPNIEFDILNVWYGCNVVIVRWRTPTPGFVQPEQQVTGIIVLEVTFKDFFADQPWLIKTVYSEFNSGAWLVDLNLVTPTTSCSASKSKRDAMMQLPRML